MRCREAVSFEIASWQGASAIPLDIDSDVTRLNPAHPHWSLETPPPHAAVRFAARARPAATA